jgi:hypothetical protein
VILDAMVVIEAHALGIWDNLLDKIDAIIPSIVVQDEAFYFDTKKTGKGGPILISQGISSGKVAEIAATATEIQSLQSTLETPAKQPSHTLN